MSDLENLKNFNKTIIIFTFLLFLIKSISNTNILNNIVLVGDDNFRYVNFATNSQGDLYFATTQYPDGNNIRKFYVINKNGKYKYKDNNGDDTPFLTIIASGQSSNYQERLEAEILFVKLSDSSDNKEYLSAIGYLYSYFEIYDMDSKSIIGQTKVSDVLEHEINSDSFTFFQQKFLTDKNYYIVAFISHYNSGIYYLSIKRFYLSSTDIINSYNYFIETKQYFPVAKRLIITCFETAQGKIICFYQDTSYQYIIQQYNSDLDEEVSNNDFGYENNANVQNNQIFFKCIHFKNEIGIFAYYQSISDVYPYISLKIFENYQINDYKGISKFSLNEYRLYSFYKLNDLIKVSDTKICYASCSDDKTILYVIMITLYNDDTKILIRYYSVNMYSLYNKKFFKDLRLHLFNNFITMGFSHCSQNSCSSDNDYHYSSIIIFNYPNGKNNNIDLITYLYNSNKNMSNINLNIDINSDIFIDNNIFGYEFKGIKIKNICNEMKLYFKETKEEINEDQIILKNQNFNFIISILKNNDEYENKDYIFEIEVIYTEPDYESFNLKAIKIIGSTSDAKNYFQKEEYIGKTLEYKFTLSNSLTTNCEDKGCILCYSNNINNCITCENIFEIDENGEKNCKYGYKCTDEQVINNECKEIIPNEQIISIYQTLEKKLLNKNYTGDDIIVKTENVIYQISKLEDQKNNNNNISSIDFKECEQKLKTQENLSENDDLIIYKVDIKSDDLTSVYIQYEIFNPYTYEKINLDICKNEEIIISVPVNLTTETEELYNNLNKYGYNLFDSNDSFYNDICTKYTTSNNTDITINDRKNDYYLKNNRTMCQTGCEFEFYNSTKKKAECKCSFQEENEIVADKNLIEFYKEQLISGFLNTLEYSNFRVMKCYKLLFSKNGIKNNIGSYVLIILLIFLIILMICYYIKERKRINYFVKLVKSQKNILDSNCSNKKFKNKKLIKTRKQTEDDGSSLKLKEKKKTKDKNEMSTRRTENSKNTKNRNDSKSVSLSQKNKNKNEPPRKITINQIGQRNKGIVSIKNPSSLNNVATMNSNMSIKKSYNLSKGSHRFSQNRVRTKNKSRKFDKINSISDKKIKTSKKYNNLLINIRQTNNYTTSSKKNLHQISTEFNDQELNTLSYKKAIKYDKRNYFQYYWSLLKKKQLILLTFLPTNDYNLMTLKLSLFILSFSLYFTVNCFFFTDSTMHKIYTSKGNFILRIPQILYSSLISSFINAILKNLSLSEKIILSLKNSTNVKKVAKTVKKKLILKFSIFFLISLLLMAFYWYFIGCFCAVYENTQKILIKDTLVSFATSMLYPFGICIIPGCFRIPALRDKKKKKFCLYKFSIIISFV